MYKALNAIFSTLFLLIPVFILLNILDSKSFAYETSCPDYMNDIECLSYLQSEASKIATEKNKISAGKAVIASRYDYSVRRRNLLDRAAGGR